MIETFYKFVSTNQISLILSAVVFYISFYFINIYNKLITLRINRNEAWSDISVYLKMRYNLIPNLVETVKAYAKHEAKTLEKVIAARGKAVANHGTPKQQAQSENILTGALRQMLAVSESYPELQANENFLKLHEDLIEIEKAIQNARQFYNGNVRILNNLVLQFPSNIIAKLFKFERADFFEIKEEFQKTILTAPSASFESKV